MFKYFLQNFNLHGVDLSHVFLCTGMCIFTGCQALPQFFQSAEDVLTDDAISVTVDVDRDALQKNTNTKIELSVDVVNSFDDSK